MAISAFIIVDEARHLVKGTEDVPLRRTEYVTQQDIEQGRASVYKGAA